MALTTCKECGGKVSTEAFSCPQCGAPQKTPPAPQAPQTIVQQQPARTESTIVQVPPSRENARIKVMEMFGWSLQNRQEMHEEGDSHGKPSLLPSLEGRRQYVTTTSVSKYVKLHFTRSLGLPNLDRIKAIESEYFALPFPPIPPLSLGIIISSIPCLPVLLSNLFVVPGKRKKAEAICRESQAKQIEVLKKLSGLL